MGKGKRRQIKFTSVESCGQLTHRIQGQLAAQFQKLCFEMQKDLSAWYRRGLAEIDIREISEFCTKEVYTV